MEGFVFNKVLNESQYLWSCNCLPVVEVPVMVMTLMLSFGFADFV